MIGPETRLVALLGKPVAHSLSPRMQNAAFAARALDWGYVACEVEADRLAAAIGGLAALGFVGANVTSPHKEAAAALCNEADGGAVNTLVFEGGRVLGFNTDAEIVRGIDAERVCLIGVGGAAKALLPALPGEVRMYARRGEWPPVAAGADLIVNATPVTDRLWFELRPEQAVVDLAYRRDGRPTELVAAARGTGCKLVVDCFEALARQGAQSFEIWTRTSAPLEVMRSAIR